MFGGNSSQGFGGNSTNFQATKAPHIANSGQNPINSTFSSQQTSGETNNPWNTQHSNKPPSSAPVNTFGSSSFGQGPSFGSTSFGTTGFGSSALANGGGVGPLISQQNTVQPPAKLSFTGSLTSNNTNNMQNGSTSGLFGSNNLNKSGDTTNNSSSSNNSHTFKCRVCQNSFPSYEELRKHMKAESHFDNTKTPLASSAPINSLQSNSIGVPSTGEKGHTTNPFATSNASAGQGNTFHQPVPSKNIFQVKTQPPQQHEDGSMRSAPAAVFGAQQSGAPRPFTAAPTTAISQDARQQFGSSLHARSTVPLPLSTTGRIEDQGGKAASSPWTVGPPSSTAATPKQIVSAAERAGPGAGGIYRPPPQRNASLNPQTKPFIPASLASNTTTAAAAPTTSTTGAGDMGENLFSRKLAPGVTGSKKMSNHALSTASGLSSGPDTSQAMVSDMSGDDGDHMSDADYVPEADSSAHSGDSEEEDDLNFSFSSQESGQVATSPVKHTRSKHLHNPAAATAIATVPGAGSSSSSSCSSSSSGGVLNLEQRRRRKNANSTTNTTADITTVAKEQQQQQMAVTTDDEQGGAMSNDDDNNAIGTCEEMCPAAERNKRLNESDIHKLEIPHSEMTPGRSDYRDTMVKKFQRSSADHALQIPHLLRSPGALLRSIEYIETELMDRASRGVLDPRIGEPPSALFIYLFVWDRYRMVAKDFTLQQAVLPLTRVWVECHERMARWFILMDHKMQAAGDFISAGHGQQNGEQLNNLLKTLHGYYFRSRAPNTTTISSSDSSSSGIEKTEFDMPNKAEFVCYFILFQLGNGGEVSKFLQQLPDEILNSQPVRFAIEVWGALKTQNYAKYFRLLRTRATLLQACLMFRYVGEVRLLGLKKMTRTLNPPGSSAQELPLVDLVRLFMFESTTEAMEFVEHCGLAVLPHSRSCSSSNSTTTGSSAQEAETEWVVPLKGQNIDSLLPRDKNDRAIPPVTYYMHEGIDRAKSLRSAAHQQNAPIGFETHYSIAEISRGFATSTAPPLFAPPPPLPTATVPVAVSSQLTSKDPTGNTNIRVRTPLTVPASEATTTTSTTTATVIDKTALRNKLLMSGSLGSGRGPKPAASPIPPVNEDDLWGPADFSTTTTSTTSGTSQQQLREQKQQKNLVTKPDSVPGIVFGSGTTGFGSPGPAGRGFGLNKPITPAKLTPGNRQEHSPSPSTATFLSASKDSSKIDSSTSWRRAAGSESDQEGKKISHIGSKKEAFSPGFENPLPQRSQQQQQQQQVHSLDPAILKPVVAAVSNIPAFQFLPSALPPIPAAVDGGPFSLRAAIASSALPTPPTATTTTIVPPTTPAAFPAEVSLQKPVLDSDNMSAATRKVVPTPHFELPVPATCTPALSMLPVSASMQQTPKKALTTEAASVPTAPVESTVPTRASPSADIHTAAEAAVTAIPQRPAVDATKLREFQDKQQRRSAKKTLQSVLSNWRNIAVLSFQTQQIRVSALYFLFWKQALRRVRKSRQAFIQGIRETKFTSAAADSTMELGLSGLSLVPSILKRKQTQRIEGEKEMRVLVQSTLKGRFHLLCDTPPITTTTAIATMGSDSIGTDVLDESKLRMARNRSRKATVDVVGRTLLAVKHWQVQEVLGQPVSETALRNLRRPLSDSSCSLLADRKALHYHGPVCFKLAVVSDGQHAGVHDKAESSPCSIASMNAVNCLRSVLANETGYGYSASSQLESVTKNQGGKMKKRRGKLAKALVSTEPHSVVRIGLHTEKITPTSTVQLSVVDVCGSSAGTNMSQVELTAQVAQLSSTKGVQGVVVIVRATSSGIDTTASAAAFCRVLRASATAVPAVLIVVSTRPSSASTPNVREFSLSEQEQLASMEGGCIVQEALQALQTAMHDCGYRGSEVVTLFQAGLLLSVCTTTSSAAASGAEQQVQSQICMEKLSQGVVTRATQLLAATAAATPLITCLRTTDWIQAYLTHTNRSITPVLPIPQQLSMTTALDVSELREYCHASFMRYIEESNARVAALLSLLEDLHSSAKDAYSAGFPVLDFICIPQSTNSNSSVVTTEEEHEGVHKKSPFLSDAVVSLLQLEHIQEGEGSSKLNTAESLRHLPIDWFDRSQYPVLIDRVTRLILPVWESQQSISQYQTVLLQFLSDHCASSHSAATMLSSSTTARNIHTTRLLEALQEVLNAAHHSSCPLFTVDAALSTIVRNILIERLEACRYCFPAHFYAVLDRRHTAVLRDIFPTIDKNVAADTEVQVHVPTMSSPMLFSPIAGTTTGDRGLKATGDMFSQTHHTQVFPTGFGRSLFASFSAAAVGGASTGTPGGRGSSEWGSPTTPYSHTKTKRSFTEDNECLNNNAIMYSDKKAYSEYKQQGDADCSTGTVDAEALLTAAFKRAKHSSVDTQPLQSPLQSKQQLLFGSPCTHTIDAVGVYSASPHTPAAARETLAEQVKEEQRAAARLTALLQSTLQHQHLSTATTAAAAPAVESAPDLSDPFRFIEQCRREREQFAHTPL